MDMSSGIHLSRFVLVKFSPDRKANFAIDLDKVEVAELARVEDSKLGLFSIVEAKVELEKPPIVTCSKELIIPKKILNELEECIEIAINLVSVADGSSKTITSANPTIGLSAELDKEDVLAVLKQIKKVKSSPMTVSIDLADRISEEVMGMLMDREEGVQILAEAISQTNTTGKFREYTRVFERAFRLSGKQLAEPLEKFLNKRFNYSRQEIDSWIKVRDNLTHADERSSKKLAFEKDTLIIEGRVKQAAYDVLLNKKNWRKKDTIRSENYLPYAGTTSNSGDMYIVRGTGLQMKVQMFDNFGSYPMNIINISTILRRMKTRYWLDTTFEANKNKQGGLEVINASDLSP